ncbi:MAG: hypothetical protein M1541_13850 [Acidobacteria bacterium]|nr:hypothetical protein [Acidobacteriota bacterium]
MNRNAFGPWGLDQAPERFARALAALGVLQGGSWRRANSHSAAAELTARLEEIHFENGGLLPWTAYIPPQGWPLPAATAADAWDEFALHHRPLPVQAELLDTRLSPLWVLEQLWRAADAVSLAAPAMWPGRRWHWPLRVGFLEDSESARLAGEIGDTVGGSTWLAPLATPASGPDCDLLLLPFDVPRALAAVLAAPHHPRAIAAIALGGLGSAADTIGLLRSLQTQVSGNAAAALPVPGRRGEWFADLMAEISHNRTFDLALALAARQLDLTPPLLLANREWLAQSRLSEMVRTLTRRMAALTGGLSRAIISDGSFDHESGNATLLADVTAAVAPQLRATPVAAPRQLQARVFDGPQASAEPLTRAFRADALHRIDVRVAPPELDWLSAGEPFPEWMLPSSESGHDLTVILSEPALLPSPQVARIHLPPAGASTLRSLPLRTLPTTTRVDARILVLYRNRVLQTVILAGAVAADPREVPEDRHISLATEVAVNPGMLDLDRERGCAGALVLNHDDAGTPRALKIVDDHAELIALDGVEQWVKDVETRLGDCDWGAQDFSGLTSPGSVGLLEFLARHGCLLYRAVVKSQFLDQAMAEAPRLQVVAARPETRLPVEYFYELPSPRQGAPLCDRAGEALANGACAGCNRDKGDQCICPLGFWGLNRVIEWHLYRPQDRRELTGADFAIQQSLAACRKRLEPLASAVLGASRKADMGVKGSVTGLQTKLAAAVPNSAGPASRWAEWRQDICTLSPSLLVLIPHTDRDTDRILTMEIGGDVLAIDHIDESCIRGPQTSSPPIVLLLGCETGSADISFEGIVSQIRLFGPSVVVSTSTRILGRQATVVAAEFLEQLAAWRGKPNATFGDVMLAVRRGMLGKGYPMILSVASYGDADWRL